MVGFYYGANETEATYMSDRDALNNRKYFVQNLGILLSQTRENIAGAYLDNDENVHIRWKSGYEQQVNVNMDSYMAIIRDVAKHIEL